VLEDKADVPSGLVTLMSMVPAGCGGDTTVSCVSELTTRSVTGTSPKSTSVTSDSPVPVMTTTTPPLLLPLETLSEVVAGGETLLKV
jgi:hypothetical protein